MYRIHTTNLIRRQTLATMENTTPHAQAVEWHEHADHDAEKQLKPYRHGTATNKASRSSTKRRPAICAVDTRMIACHPRIDSDGIHLSPSAAAALQCQRDSPLRCCPLRG